MVQYWELAPENGSPVAQTVHVTVFDGQQYGGEWPPEDMHGFLAWFREKLNDIPFGYRDSVRVEIGSVSGCEDSHYGHIEITYTRPETADELDSRIAKWQDACARHEEDQRRAYEDLKAKFGEGQ